MAGRVAGKVAFITGAARGQGRSHAVRLAQEGADIIAVDLCGQVATVPYEMSTPGDMAETVKAAIPHLRAAGGGSVILTSSTAGLKAIPHTGHYNSAKHGVVGLMRTLAHELAPDMIRVNSVHPTAVDTGMIQNSATYELFAADLPEAERTREALAPRFGELNLLPIPWVEAIDISNAVLWLASDESRYVTGVTLPIDAGLLIK
jgi:NAD(P)-dependent dehydrogenase (short-subunit alcohol dehydrogenase family)